jgi:hypothetical protein
MTRSSAYSNSIGQFIKVERRLTKFVSQTGVGGINPHKFAEDGEASFLDLHPTWVFA